MTTHAKEKKTIVCDVCEKPITTAYYWVIRIKDDKSFDAHHNCGLYLRLSIPFLRKTGLLTGFVFEEKSQHESRPNISPS